MTKDERKEALKQLRQKRKATIDRARSRIKSQNRRFAAIRSQLGEAPRTVPEIAAALKLESAEVMMCVAALRKYGEVVETTKDGDYFRYRLAAKEA